MPRIVTWIQGVQGEALGRLANRAFIAFREFMSLWQAEQDISTWVSVLWAIIVPRVVRRSSLTVPSATDSRIVAPVPFVVDVGSISTDKVTSIVSRNVRTCPPTEDFFQNSPQRTLGRGL